MGRLGDPKRARRKFETPRHPWRAEQLELELKLLGEYALRNKHELWRHRTELSRIRGMARSILGMTGERRIKLEQELLSRLHRMGLLPEKATLDEALRLEVRDMLERRLQTIVFRSGLARSPHQARQLIVHGHIVVGGKTVTVPSYIVSRDEEATVAYAPTSPLADPDHPARREIMVKPTAASPE